MNLERKRFEFLMFDVVKKCLLRNSVVHPDPAGSEIICKLGSGSVINSGSDSGSKLSSVSN